MWVGGWLWVSLLVGVNAVGVKGRVCGDRRVLDVIYVREIRWVSGRSEPGGGAPLVVHSDGAAMRVGRWVLVGRSIGTCE